MSRSRNKHNDSRRERRAFSAEFKAEAVQLMRDRRTLGVSLAQIGRELDVRPDQLRVWARQLARRNGEQADRESSEPVEQEVRGGSPVRVERDRGVD